MHRRVLPYWNNNYDLGNDTPDINMAYLSAISPIGKKRIQEKAGIIERMVA